MNGIETPASELANEWTKQLQDDMESLATSLWGKRLEPYRAGALDGIATTATTRAFLLRIGLEKDVPVSGLAKGGAAVSVDEQDAIPRGKIFRTRCDVDRHARLRQSAVLDPPQTLDAGRTPHAIFVPHHILTNTGVQSPWRG